MDADLTPYRLLHSAGRLAVDACEAARIHGLDHEEQARMLVEVYGMGRVEARQMVLRSGARSEPPSGLSDAEDSSGPLGLGLFQYRLSTLFSVPLLVAFGVTLWKWHWAPVATVVTFFIGCLMTRAARNVSPRSLPTWIASVLLLVTGMALVLWSPWLWVWGVDRPQFPATELFLFGPIGIPLLLLAGVLGGLLSTAGGSAVVAAAYGVLAAVLLGSSYWALKIEEGLAEFVVFLGSLVTTLLVLSFGWY
jgi:uncharacterized membrane protein